IRVRIEFISTAPDAGTARWQVVSFSLLEDSINQTENCDTKVSLVRMEDIPVLTARSCTMLTSSQLHH
ncbi:MAG TPA: hypothetical protein PKW28_14005, partial [Turneriella sp.]|nr:hypothetical protein [Turneriella sp.]